MISLRNIVGLWAIYTLGYYGYLAVAQEPPAKANGNQATVKPEFRALWVTRFEWPDENPDQCKKNILRIVQEVADANFNVMLFQVRGAAEVLYHSALEPWSALVGTRDPGFDPLDFAIAESHRRGLQLHAYINPIPLYLWSRTKTLPPDTKPQHLFYLHGPDAKESWVCTDVKHKVMDAARNDYFYLSPGIPQVQAYLRKVILDVVRRYDLDGIHLDRIRYPGREYSHDPTSQERFFGRGNPNRKEWSDWQREQLNKFVSDLYAEIMAEKPAIVLSCAAWGIYDRYRLPGYSDFSSGYHDYYQDTWEWISLGAMDLLMPMIYWNIADPKPNYDELLQDFVAGVGADRICGGQRLYGSDWKLEENIAQVEWSRRLGVMGNAIFSYQSARDKHALARFKSTVYPGKAPVPSLTWKRDQRQAIVLGRVTDEVGEAVTDAWVSLTPEDRTNQAPVFSQTWPSSADGRFSFLKVPPVPVVVGVEYQGIKVRQTLQMGAGKVIAVTVPLPGIRRPTVDFYFHIFKQTRELSGREPIYWLRYESSRK